MPVISLEIGGCGAGVASKFWGLIDQSLLEVDRDDGHKSQLDLKWQRAFVRSDSRQRLLARRLVIDSDPRSAPKKSRAFDSQSILGVPSKKSGCGKNWASGYSLPRANEKRKGKSTMFEKPAWNSSAKVPHEDFNLQDRIMDGIRKEVEVCTGTPEFLLWHSLAGGVGGGMTSFVLEHLRDTYPKMYIASASFGSLGAGFDPMQKINSIMCLGWLQAYVDLPMLFRPEAFDLHPRNAIASKSSPDLDLPGLNEKIAQGVAGALWPLDVDETFGGKSRISDLVTAVCPDVRTKFTEVGSTMVSQIEGRPERNPWKKALSQIIDSFPRGGPEAKSKPEIMGAMITARLKSGRSKGSYEKIDKTSDRKENLHTSSLSNRFGASLTMKSKQERKGNHLGVELMEHQFTKSLRLDVDMLEFRQGSACIPSIQETKRKTWSGYRGGSHDAKSVTIVANLSSFADYARKLAASGQSLCQAGAFLHWYEAQDISKDAILEMINRMEAVADQYKMASSSP
ncbi:hypothetical protein BSKO_03915 [Bryopsis sp. KO-2023]|nr:hypothetical protein BSKO_03915 [Bryopsis sp. KO-2023]